MGEGCEAICAARARTLPDRAFARLVAQPWVSSIIVGASLLGQAQQNVPAAEWTLTLARVDVAWGQARAEKRRADMSSFRGLTIGGHRANLPQG